MLGAKSLCNIGEERCRKAHNKPRKGSPKGEFQMVFVLDKHKKPLMPCTEKRAKLLLSHSRAVVHRVAPFTIRLKDRVAEKCELQPLRLKLDPGSKVTGLAVLREEPGKVEAIFLGEIRHKPGIKAGLDTRRALRRNRRNRKLRYRKARFLNRRRKEGWLPPSLEARVKQTMSAVNKLTSLLPITAISTEHVKFDTQLMQNPDIAGAEYQHGQLIGYEIREYLLEKWGRRCAYCEATGLPLEVEHVVPKNPKRGPKGTDRISNLALGCYPCNEVKGNKQPEEWLVELQKSKKAIDKRRVENLPKVIAKLKVPLRDAAMMNATRWRLFERLKETNLSVEYGTGARTKMQRIAHGLSKTHYYDACCVGASTPAKLEIAIKYVSVWTATGRGSRQLCNPNAYGFPKGHRKSQKLYFGFQTGDMVVASIPKGKYKARHVGRVAVRATGYFDIKNGAGKRTCQGISWGYLQLLQKGDGWHYEKICLSG